MSEGDSAKYLTKVLQRGQSHERQQKVRNFHRLEETKKTVIIKFSGPS